MKANVKNLDKRGLSPLISTLLLIAASVIGGALVYAVFAGQTATITSRVDVQVQSSDIVVTESMTLITANVKNVGTVPLDNCVITVYSETPSKQYKIKIGAIDVGETGSGDNMLAAFADYHAGKTYAAELFASTVSGQTVTKSWSIVAK